MALSADGGRGAAAPRFQHRKTCMRFLASLACLAILVSGEAQSPSANAPPAAAEAAAAAAALGWLGLVDAADYAQSWASGAEYFRHSILESPSVASLAQ